MRKYKCKTWMKREEKKENESRRKGSEEGKDRLEKGGRTEW